MAFFVFKSLHLIAMVTWFAGIFYMFRLFVYHAENKDDASRAELLKIMARKLYKIITVPGMVATFVFGIAMLVINPEILRQPWMHIKLTLVLVLGGYTFFVGRTRRRFENDDVYLTSKQCRMLNEVPTLLLFAIVFVAVFRFYMMGSVQG
ncbi:protoporphyrinogen oxidase HemJ [Sulfidibacter corallicola]|uniref:Protoporphyrinogen IX oxidase n=1 Tax=Sulfidibacter corallicola TaxID=2818388 RepID=A0A8A4TVW1_SULCO|nr:protoporphyrinogen oxidase HemJ [Sulfidibacter corallicola]QTD54079.1 protoporphyrinogen oxidase HemJ [Sulfidibacter corallicola]